MAVEEGFVISQCKKWAKELGGVGVLGVVEKSRDTITGIVIYTMSYKALMVLLQLAT